MRRHADLCHSPDITSWLVFGAVLEFLVQGLNNLYRSCLFVLFDSLLVSWHSGGGSDGDVDEDDMMLILMAMVILIIIISVSKPLPDATYTV